MRTELPVQARAPALLLLLVLAVAVPAAVAVAGCAGASEDPPTATTTPFEITSPPGVVFTDSTVRFTLVNTDTGETVESTRWHVATPHNVPGDRGIMRSDGLYTAPRIVPVPRTVRISVRLGRDYGRADVFREIDIIDPAHPDPDATVGPGMTIYDMHHLETTRPLEQGLRF